MANYVYVVLDRKAYRLSKRARAAIRRHNRLAVRRWFPWLRGKHLADVLRKFRKAPVFADCGDERCPACKSRGRR